MFESQYLIIARSSKLRQKLFEKLCAKDLRVDAVGNARSAQRRIDKDKYDLIIFQDCFENFTLDSDEYPIFNIHEEDENKIDDLVERIWSHIQQSKASED